MSAVSAQNGIPQQLSEMTWFWPNWLQEMDLCPYQSILLNKAFLFDKPAPKLNLPYLATLLDEKALCIGQLFCPQSSALVTVLYISCTIQSKKFCADLHF